MELKARNTREHLNIKSRGFPLGDYFKTLTTVESNGIEKSSSVDQLVVDIDHEDDDTEDLKRSLSRNWKASPRASFLYLTYWKCRCLLQDFLCW